MLILCSCLIQKTVSVGASVETEVFKHNKFGITACKFSAVINTLPTSRGTIACDNCKSFEMTSKSSCTSSSKS